MVTKTIDESKRYQSAIRDEKKRIFEARTEKWCNRCCQVLPLDDFYPPSVSGLSKISGWCRKCNRSYAKERSARRRIVRERRGIK
jgi:hypothetical protein